MHSFLHHVYAITWLATWGNNMAWLESLAAAGLVAWVTHKTGLLPKLTDHVGRTLAAWWAKHHGPHAIAQQREALRQHEEAKKGQT